MLANFIKKPGFNRFLSYLKHIIIDTELWRRNLRDNLIQQIILCTALGVIVGLITALLHEAVILLHQNAFMLPYGANLSTGSGVSRMRILIVPALGGLLLGIFYLIMNRLKQREIVDPIEANAIYGGRMSIKDSLVLVIATLISNSAGSSVGMEAAYTQMGSSILSRLGQRFKLRREDLRIFVAAGAAAAIAAAFNAPVAGAFYGFELILGSYTVSALSQVSAASLAGAMVIRILTKNDPIFSLPQGEIVIVRWEYPLFIMLGIASALVAILTMKSVSRCESIIKKLSIPEWMRPALGGILLSITAISFPQVLGSGQGAINNHLHNNWPLFALILLLIAKIASSAISIGTGFRGGLFSSSLFIGCLLGGITGMLANYILPETSGQLTSFMLVGIGSVAASIIGAPITMVLLVLEMTGNFPVTTGVLLGVLVSSAITRYVFGYSFSTWRFHLRGLRISGAYDIGWIRELTVEKIMRTGVKTVPSSMTVGELRNFIPAGSTTRVFVVDGDELYQGIIDVAALYNETSNDNQTNRTAADFTIGKHKFLLASQDIRNALNAFTNYELEELPVIESQGRPKIIGYVTESYALKRYNQELEARSLIPNLN
jgi:CIC family chloride channel protein